MGFPGSTSAEYAKGATHSAFETAARSSASYARATFAARGIAEASFTEDERSKMKGERTFATVVAATPERPSPIPERKGGEAVKSDADKGSGAPPLHMPITQRPPHVSSRPIQLNSYGAAELLRRTKPGGLVGKIDTAEPASHVEDAATSTGPLDNHHREDRATSRQRDQAIVDVMEHLWRSWTRSLLSRPGTTAEDAARTASEITSVATKGSISPAVTLELLTEIDSKFAGTVNSDKGPKDF